MQHTAKRAHGMVMYCHRRTARHDIAMTAAHARTTPPFHRYGLPMEACLVDGQSAATHLSLKFVAMALIEQKPAKLRGVIAASAPPAIITSAYDR